MASSSKRPPPRPTPQAPASQPLRKKLSLGKVANDSDALFLPASAEECSLLINRWKHLPNTASPAFSLPHYTHIDDVNFKTVLDQNVDDIRPDTFYPPQLSTFCQTFSTGAVSAAEGYQLYQALVFLQRGLSRLIRGHLSKVEIHRRLMSFTALPNFSHSLEYYQLYWHGRQNCPLVAPLLMILLCEFCEEHLTPAEYAARVYDVRKRDGPGMSSKTRDRLLEDIRDIIELQDLAIPLPFDPSTREGQLILNVTSQGSRVDKIAHPIFRTVLQPDPAFQISALTKTLPSPVTKTRLRPPSPNFDAVTPHPSTDLARPKCRPPQAFPVPSSDVEMEGEDDVIPSEIFKSPGNPDVLVLRQSIAHAAKSKPLLPEEVRKAPTPLAGVKRDHSPGNTKSEPAPAEPPKKRRRTQKVAGKSRAGSTAPTLDDPATPADLESLRIQEGEPAYFHGDDTRVTAHANFLTNPNFQVKTPFSQLIRKAVATNKRGSKIPFLRAPKWKVSEEMKNFGAFATIGDTTFSLQGLSRFGYASSRFLWPTNNRTLPSPEALYSTNNCLMCTTRGQLIL
ncbi:hypothetical protein EV360DRAFT_90743 [Lentinula raphanica]|nr:hypothetical protein EV360DRAFT_90743 [Lentinula raphanica]